MKLRTEAGVVAQQAQPPRAVPASHVITAPVCIPALPVPVWLPANALGPLPAT